MHAVMWTFPAIFRIPSKRQKALSKSRQMLGELTDKVWKERKQAGLDGQDPGKSILELLLRAELAGAGNGLGEQEIAAEVRSNLSAAPRFNIHYRLNRSCL